MAIAMCACSGDSGQHAEDQEDSPDVLRPDTLSDNLSSTSRYSSMLPEVSSESQLFDGVSSSGELIASSASESSSSLNESLSQGLDSLSSSSQLVSESSSSVEDSPIEFDFYIGADISTVQEYERWGTKFYDVDGSEKDVFALLKNHGFNAIRLKTFVSPSAKYGYAAAGCEHDAEAYADKDHIVAYAKKIKAAGMAFLLDIHYSDNWADPGKQIIPSRWRNVQSSDALADSVRAYTFDLLSALKQAGAMPAMVQIGNETTPGILMHVPNSKTDCWGNGVDKAPASVNGDMGSESGRKNAAKYFEAGISAVRAVSSSIKTVLHIEGIHKQNTVEWWMNEIFKNQKVEADIMGFSAYTAYGNGTPGDWMNLFEKVSTTYSNLKFIVAEYNGGDKSDSYPFDGSRKRTNEMVRSLNRWIGTFFWEPTLSGPWGASLFDWKDGNLYANKKAFEEYPEVGVKKDLR